MLSIPALPSMDSIDSDGMYYSEPEMVDRCVLSATKGVVRASSMTSGTSSGKSSPVGNAKFFFAPYNATSEISKEETDGSAADTLRLPAVYSRGSSAEASEDEDGTLFRTLTSEGAEQVRQANAELKLSPKVAAPMTRPVSPMAELEIGMLRSVSKELTGVPDTAQLSRLPASHLRAYATLPAVVEYVVNHGILVCLSALLYELTFMPVSGIKGLWKAITCRSMTYIEKSDFHRTLVLIVAAVVFNYSIDFSVVYHYIRAQSLLKLYFIYNMLEIIERLVRSWGNDLVDGLVRSSALGKSGFSVLLHWLVVLVYSLGHAYIHFWRVMLISVAMLANDMLIVLLTNNFNELKGTVFKKSEARSLYPVISSDIVERTYLFIDVGLVVFRMATSPQRSKMPFNEVAYWIGFMIGLEVLTDWLKFLCISKFNQIDNSTYWHFNRIHKDDILNARNSDMNPIPPLVQKGFVSASHLPGRRMNFMPTPLAILILCNVMLPNLVGSEPFPLWAYRILLISGLFLAKVAVDWILIGDSASSDRSTPLPEKLQTVRSL